MKKQHGFIVGCSLCLFALGGCALPPDGGPVVGEYERERVRISRPERGGDPPVRERVVEGGVPSQMLLSRGTPLDMDANGYPDTIPVVVYLFGDGRGAPTPIRSSGTFRFALVTEGGQGLGKWTFPPEAGVQAEREMAPGPAYAFYLRLGPGEDSFSTTTCVLSGAFTHRSGARASSGGGTTVRMGGAR